MDDLPVVETWTASERWAWQELAAGRPADFTTELSKDPRLSYAFLDTIFKAPYASRIPNTGVKIKGVRVDGDMHVRGPLAGGLSIAASRFDKSLFVDSAKIAGDVDLDDVEVEERVWFLHADIGGSIRLHEVGVAHVLLDRSKVAGDVLIAPSLDKLMVREGKPRGRPIRGRLSANEAAIGGSFTLMHIDVGSISLDDLSIGGSVDTFDLKVDENVSADRIAVTLGTHFHDTQCGGRVLLRQSTLGRDLSFSGSADGLEMGQARVHGNFYLTGALKGLDLERISIDSDAVFRNLKIEVRYSARLKGMRIGGSLIFEKIDCSGHLVLDESRIQADLSIGHESTIREALGATLIQVGGSVKLGGSTLNGAVFAGADVKGDFSLVSDFDDVAQWVGTSQLDLHNAEVGAISDQPFTPRGVKKDPWPAKLDLRGFKFRKLVAYTSGQDRLALSLETLKAWLARDTSGTMQPYVQFAKALQEAGELSKANSIMYEGRERERSLAGKYTPLWFGLSALKWTIGYGLGARYFRALSWVGGFIVVGIATLYVDQRVSGHPLTTESHRLVWMAFASLDALLPIVSLDKTFSDNVPACLSFMTSKFVFWVLGIAGWILGSFLVAGFAGLTQKSS